MYKLNLISRLRGVPAQQLRFKNRELLECFLTSKGLLIEDSFEEDLETGPYISGNKQYLYEIWNY